jgi:hypothetical protein
VIHAQAVHHSRSLYVELIHTPFECGFQIHINILFASIVPRTQSSGVETERIPTALRLGTGSYGGAQGTSCLVTVSDSRFSISPFSASGAGDEGFGEPDRDLALIRGEERMEGEPDREAVLAFGNSGRPSSSAKRLCVTRALSCQSCRARVEGRTIVKANLLISVGYPT